MIGPLFHVLKTPLRKVVLTVFLSTFATALAEQVVHRTAEHFWPAAKDEKKKKKKK